MFFCHENIDSGKIQLNTRSSHAVRNVMKRNVVLGTFSLDFHIIHVLPYSFKGTYTYNGYGHTAITYYSISGVWLRPSLFSFLRHESTGSSAFDKGHSPITYNVNKEFQVVTVSRGTLR